MSSELPRFFINHLPIFGEAILAPMDGYSILPFRQLARSFGSAISYTPFINAQELIDNQPHAWSLLDFDPAERPVAFQIYGNEEAQLLEAALRIQERGPDFIDLNMGCSVRRIARRGAGAGMLKDPEKSGRIMARLVQALEVPVTAKIRIGLDAQRLNHLQVAQILEDNGAAMIAVHGRTRAQAYNGAADWQAIAEVKQAVRIPVVGNGDICCAADIDQMLQETGVDAVMIGRAARGNPWIFQRRDRHDVPADEYKQVIATHLRQMLSWSGGSRGAVRFRKHLVFFLEPFAIEAEVRRKLLAITDPEVLLGEIASLNLVPYRQLESSPHAV